VTDEKQMGRPAIYRNKDAKNIHGMITTEGEKAFELARKALAKIVDWKPERVSDGDVVMFLAMGFKAKESREACSMQLEKYLGRR